MEPEEKHYCPACGSLLHLKYIAPLLYWCNECQDVVNEEDSLDEDERLSMNSLWEDEE